MRERAHSKGIKFPFCRGNIVLDNLRLLRDPADQALGVNEVLRAGGLGADLVGLNQKCERSLGSHKTNCLEELG